MNEPYVYTVGNNPDCEHENVTESILTVIPPIREWRCNDCRRVVRQSSELAKTVMPEVKQKFDPDKYSWARMRLEGDWLYRSDYLHNEDEEIPDEFTITDDIYRAYLNHRWGREFHEIRVDAKYNLTTGTVELLGIDGVKLEKPIKLR